MSDGPRRPRPLLAAAWLVAAASAGLAQTPSTGIGRPATPTEIASWGAIVGPEGEGLPPGRGTVSDGRAVYLRRCVRCHGRDGTGGSDDVLVGGRGSLAGDTPRKTVGSYWPAATTLWDYVNRAMPFDQPGVLGDDEVYAVVAYVLYLNELIAEDDVVDAVTLPRVEMPNRHGFVPDPRPDIASGRDR